ncbi:receptor coactivator 7 [Seminavis robusta]|uniref:Oxidation resistance protein 1 n=1 Tax=Seminavis robusta TaxID=568900 RepID=A0A9N8E421_9STRA|nr:receptor coactivator 7 [Seminavis robusta]|eukprot:Sro596_g172880.1 receptor coactivator 7 (504) ;mRNA; r:47117-48628
MAATQQIFRQLLNLCASENYPRSGLAELCFPNYESDQHDEDNQALSWIPRVQIVDEPNHKNSSKFLLDAAQMHQIACSVLPKELAFHRWKRVFSLARDGPSFYDFIYRIRENRQTLLIVKTTRGELFGGFSDSPWEMDNQYFHGGEQSKLFTFVKRSRRGASGSSDDSDNVVNRDSCRSLERYDSRDDDHYDQKSEKKESLTVYPWSGLNRHVQYCDPGRTLIAFGGGGARFGLSIEQSFRFGSTGPCETFGNEKLGTDENFRVSDVEVWGFVDVEETCCSSLLCFQPLAPAEEDVNFIPSVRVDRVDPQPETFILDQQKMDQIARFVLPRTIASCRWKRVYSLSRDGDAFEVCLHLVRKEQRSLMVIRTEDNQIFGGYADSPWSPSNSNYYGSAQACLWTFANTRNGAVRRDSGTGAPIPPNQVKVYKWTGTNRYIQFCDVTHRILAFGGGGDAGSFGLCVEKDFENGSSGPCATFGNQPLCDKELFKIVDLEIWGFATGKF